MEFNSEVPAHKEGTVTEVMKPKGNNEETPKNRKSFIEHDFQRSYNEIGIRNTKTNNGKKTSIENEKVPEAFTYIPNANGRNVDNGKENRNKIATKKFALALPAYCVQKLGTVDDIKKSMWKNEEPYNNIKIEDDLQRSGNEIRTGNTKTNNGKRTSIKHEEVPKFSPYFRNDYGKKGDNGRENRDEIAIETIKSKRKTHADNKIDSEPCYDRDGNGDETAIGNIKSKQKRRWKKHKLQSDNEKKVETGLCCGSQKNGDEIPIEKSKSKRKKRSKKCELQGESKENIDPELRCYGCDIGCVKDKLLADAKIKSKEKKKRAVEDLLQEIGDDVETGTFKLKKMGPEVHENIVHNGTSKKKKTVVSVVFSSASGNSEDKLKVNGNGFESISIKLEKSKYNTQKTVGECAKVRVVAPNFQSDTSNVKPVKMKTVVQKKLKVNISREKIKQQGQDSHTDSVVVSVASGDLQEVQGIGNEIETIEVEFKKMRKRVNVKALDHESDFDSGALVGKHKM